MTLLVFTTSPVSVVSMEESLTSLGKWILERIPARVLTRDNSLTCRPRFALFCQHQEVTIAGAWGHGGEVESHLNGFFNSTSLVPRRCYCTWCKTAQVALIQRAHAAGPRTLSASQWPTIPWAVLRWISLPMLCPGGSPEHRTSSFLRSQSIGYSYT